MTASIFRRPGWVVLAAMLLAPLRPAGAGEGSGAAQTPDGPSFVKIPSIAFSVVGDDNRIKKEVQLMINLELEKGQPDTVLDASRRQLQDAFLVSLSDLWDSRANDPVSIPGEEIKDLLLRVTNRVVGPGKVHEVLIIGISERSHNR